MTLHAAKGLEFPIICLTGLEDGLFPSQQTAGDPRDLEEERRLLYVGITRAMRRCFIFYAQQRLRFGETVQAMPSRFIEEIKRSGATEHVTSFGTKPRSRETYADRSKDISHLLSGSPVVNGRTFTRKRRERSPESGYFSDGPNSSDYSQIEEQGGVKRGTRVFHETFGEGRVIEIAGAGEKAKAMVEFSKFGRKSLMLKFANLRVL